MITLQCWFDLSYVFQRPSIWKMTAENEVLKLLQAHKIVYSDTERIPQMDKEN